MNHSGLYCKSFLPNTIFERTLIKLWNLNLVCVPCAFISLWLHFKHDMVDIVTKYDMKGQVIIAGAEWKTLEQTMTSFRITHDEMCCKKHPISPAMACRTGPWQKMWTKVKDAAIKITSWWFTIYNNWCTQSGSAGTGYWGYGHGNTGITVLLLRECFSAHGLYSLHYLYSHIHNPSNPSLYSQTVCTEAFTQKLHCNPCIPMSITPVTPPCTPRLCALKHSCKSYTIVPVFPQP